MSGGQIETFPLCFGCGESNESGLRLKLDMRGERLSAEFLPGQEHQGWPGMVHGGIIASLLYELLENYAYYRGETTMMSNMETRYRRPAQIGTRLLANSWLVDRSGRKMSVAAALTDARQQVIAEGKADLLVLSARQKSKLGL